MMKLETKKALQNAMNEISFNKELSYEKLERLVKKYVSMQTFRKYMIIEKFEKIEYDEWCLESVLDLLNSCAGDDCYSCNWNFQQINGKIYDVNHYNVYIVKGYK